MVSQDQLSFFGGRLRKEGKTLVTINGSFDLIHPGHLKILYEASCQADVLLVLLNSDTSIKSYKEKNRPVNTLKIRLQQMAALEVVDYMSYFNETDPTRVLDLIKPDIHCNGSDYGEDCIESRVVKKNGGRIHIVKLVEGYSTTNLITRIKKICD